MERPYETVVKQIDAICEDICDFYCKYPEQYGPGDDELARLMADHCEDCPLNKLH